MTTYGECPECGIHLGHKLTCSRVAPPPVKTNPTHLAAIGTAPDVVIGETCDLTIAPAELVTYDVRDGVESPVYEMSSVNPLTLQLETSLSDDDRDVRAMREADDILTAGGYRRMSDWKHGANALYATLGPRYQSA